MEKMQGRRAQHGACGGGVGRAADDVAVSGRVIKEVAGGKAAFCLLFAQRAPPRANMATMLKYLGLL
jgi:hypothetical protein